MSVLFVISTAVVARAAAGDSSLLFQAIRNGDVAYLKGHLSKADIEVRDRRGATPLMHAAAFGNLATLTLLLDAGADVNAHNDFDATALLWSARDPDKARLLIERGANVNVKSKQGRTPLMIASLRRGGSPIVALMLAKGADVKVRNRFGGTALSLAASVGDAEAIKLLLAAGADANVADAIGATPINWGSDTRQAEALRLLIQKGVDVNSSVASLEEMFDPDRLKDTHTPGGFTPPDKPQRAIKGHEFGLKLNPEERKQLIAFLRTL